MIVKREMSPAAGWIWDLRPNRSIGVRGLSVFFAVMCAVSAAVNGYSYTQGNVYAPLFGVAELSALALCLWLVRRKLSVDERIRLTAQVLRVEAPGTQANFHPGWVKLSRDGQGRVRLRSHGREIEIGAFLSERERDELAASVNDALTKLKR